MTITAIAARQGTVSVAPTRARPSRVWFRSKRGQSAHVAQSLAPRPRRHGEVREPAERHAGMELQPEAAKPDVLHVLDADLGCRDDPPGIAQSGR